MTESNHERVTTASAAERGARGRRFPWLWVALVAGFVPALLTDDRVMAALAPVHTGRFADLVNHTVKWLGNGHFQLPVLVLLLLVGWLVSRPVRRAAGWGLVAYGVSGAAANVVKVLVHRPRPYVTGMPPTSVAGFIHNHDYQSFPSGDTSTVFAIAATMSYFLPVTRAPLLIAAVAVALGRVVVGAHHPGDVLAGAILGLAVGRLVIATSQPGAVRRAAARAWPFALLAAYAAAILFAGLGHLPLFGRDESLYAEAAREMYASGDWITPRINGLPFFEKPPLNYWLAAVSYHGFGVSPLAARLPAALLGIATVLLTALVGARVWGRRAGLLAGLALASSLQVAFIGRLGIMDVPLMGLTTLALLAYAAWRLRGGLRYAVAFGALVGLAVLLKSLAGSLPALVAGLHCLFARPTKLRPWIGPALVAVVVAAAVAGPWFLTLALRDTSFWPTFLRENFSRMGRPMQGHGGSLLLYLPYYPALILVGFFPWVMFLPAAMRRHAGAHRSAPEEAARLWHSLAVTWFWTVLVAFSLMSTKLPGYVTPLFPAMALLVGAELDRQLDAPGRGAWIAVIAGAAVLAAVVLFLPFVGARLGERVGAADAARGLAAPAFVWIAAYGIIVLGAAGMVLPGLRSRSTALGLVVAGQTLALAAVLGGILPILSPYMEGAREHQLARLAQRELPGLEVVLYDTRPEAVCFVLGHPVRVYGRTQPGELARYAQGRRVAVIAPAREAPTGLKTHRRWQVGNGVLIEVRR